MSSFQRFFKPDQIKKRPEDTICVLPWVHLNIRPNGKVLQCCMTLDHKNYAGDLKKQSIEEVWNGRFLRTMRKQMLNGIEPEMCRRCFDDERVCGSSIRTLKNGHFADKLKEIPQITRPDGSVEQVELKYWDFRFSNLCNYKCRTCEPEASSSWYSDYKALGSLNAFKKIKQLKRLNSVDHSTVEFFLKKYLSTVEQIYFAGGEPLLMDEHWQILDLLDEHKRYDVSLTYSTNLSILKYKNKNVLDYWAKWGSKVTLLPSIDDTGRRAELIRCGTNWSTVETNLKAVNQIGVFMMPNITVSAMNIFTITDLIDYLTETGIINHTNKWWQNFNFNMVITPTFHVSILPDEVRKDIRKKLDTYIDHYEQKYDVVLRPQFTSLFSHLDKPWNKKNCRLFKDFTKSIDRIRGENTLDVIPELACILKK